MISRALCMSTGLASLLAGAAFAGGPATPYVEPRIIAPEAVSPPTPFAGAYVGGGIGYAFKGDDEVGLSNGTDLGDLELGGALAEAHVGYRWQPGVFVWGVELGIEGGNVEDEIALASTEMKYAATLRGISGWTPNPETLVYGFAGIAHGKFDYTVGPFEQDLSVTGYVAGFGVERLLNDRWSLRGEYQYTDFGKERLAEGALSTQATPKYHSIRVGVNYRF